MFKLTTHTSWQKKATHLQLHDMHEAMSNYPLIERKFFDDLIELCRKQDHYFVEMGLLNLENVEKKTVNPDFWILIYAADFKDRVYEILIERHPSYGGKGAIAAVGPIDFLEFVSKMKKNAIMPTLTLLNSPEKIKKLGIIVSRPKSYQEAAQEKKSMEGLNRFKNWIDELKMTPNKNGQWFPGDFRRCPKCEGPMVGVQDPNDASKGILMCTMCGFQEHKALFGNNSFFGYGPIKRT